jgi:hypothetical protein
MIACLCGLSIVIPLTIFVTKKYLKEGKSVKYLSLKICMAVGIPVMSIPILLSDISWPREIVAIVFVASSGALYLFCLITGRGLFGQLLGLPAVHRDQSARKDEKDKEISK